jgi:hypothetical protein
MSVEARSVDSPYVAERRKLQNREAQRRYRENIKRKLKDAEAQMKSSSSSQRLITERQSNNDAENIEEGMSEDSTTYDLVGLGSLCSSPSLDSGSSP